jgi:hypothetical protein
MFIVIQGRPRNGDTMILDSAVGHGRTFDAGDRLRTEELPDGVLQVSGSTRIAGPEIGPARVHGWSVLVHHSEPTGTWTSRTSAPQSRRCPLMRPRRPGATSRRRATPGHRRCGAPSAPSPARLLPGCYPRPRTGITKGRRLRFSDGCVRNYGWRGKRLFRYGPAPSARAGRVRHNPGTAYSRYATTPKAPPGRREAPGLQSERVPAGCGGADLGPDRRTQARRRASSPRTVSPAVLDCPCRRRAADGGVEPRNVLSAQASASRCDPRSIGTIASVSARPLPTGWPVAGKGGGEEQP